MPSTTCAIGSLWPVLQNHEHDVCRAMHPHSQRREVNHATLHSLYDLNRRGGGFEPCICVDAGVPGGCALQYRGSFTALAPGCAVFTVLVLALGIRNRNCDVHHQLWGPAEAAPFSRRSAIV